MSDHTLLLAEALKGRYAVAAFSPDGFPLFAAGRMAEAIAARGCFAAVVPYTPNLYGTLNPFPVLLLRQLKRRGLRTLVFIHEIFMPEYRTWRGRLFTRQLNYVKDRLVAALSDIPVVSFAARAREFERRTGRRPAVIPVFSNLPDLGETAPGLTHAFGSFGNPHHDVRFDVFAAALLAMPGARMLWVGAKPAAGAPDRIDFTGHLALEEAARALRRMKVYVLCDARGLSFRKGSAAAALGSGIPVVANRTEWTDPAFVHGENVFFFDGTPEGLVLALRTLEETPGLAVRLGENGRRLYDTVMSRDIAARTVAGLLEAE